MADDEHVAMLGRGATKWNERRATHDETPDLSRAGLRGLDLSGFDLSRADLRGADLRGTNLSGANLSGAHLDGANLFKAVLYSADLAGAFLNGAQFLNCAQLVVARNWQKAFRDETLGCGASIPNKNPSE
jgi:uncharacterized protein YjbI with pentapeptide repeats